MPYEIELTDMALDEIDALRAFDRRRIVDEMDAKLTYEPLVETRNRKPLKILYQSSPISVLFGSYE
jgi:hypothetical protein